MLSVVVVGRNDSHGYNLSKRVATSLNSIALPMSGEDELIFVDWNSDDINPTFIDAIKDTLTEKTLKHLVVYRVRPSLHQFLANGIKRPILEPIARNVGIRRAKNDWILSTNTDMIFNTFGKTYNEILAKFTPNLYHLFRYEIPEYFWDTLDRSNPEKTLSLIEEKISKNNLFYGILTEPFKGYANKFPDAVGDFQLAPRRYWESVKGFPEDMLRGWHVDSRLSVQMEKKTNSSSLIIDSSIIQGFHQNHLRVLTHFHSPSVTNPLEMVSEEYENSDDWGLVKFNLKNSVSKVDKFVEKNFFYHSQENSNETLQEFLMSPFYNPNLIDFFLSDDIINLPEKTTIGFSSLDVDFYQRLARILQVLDKDSDEIEIVNLQDKQNFNDIDLYIVDFGLPELLLYEENVNEVLVKFEKHIKRNIEILSKSLTNAKIVSIRSQHWTLRGLIREYCNVPLFNNYPNLLSGTKLDKRINPALIQLNSFRNFLRRKILILNVTSLIADRHRLIHLSNKSQSFLIRNQRKGIAENLYAFERRLPSNFRIFVNRKIRDFFRIN